MDHLEISYWKAHYRETKRIREYMIKHGDLPDEIKKDMYSDEKLEEDNIPPKAPRIGPDYQVDPKYL